MIHQILYQFRDAFIFKKDKLRPMILSTVRMSTDAKKIFHKHMIINVKEAITGYSIQKSISYTMS